MTISRDIDEARVLLERAEREIDPALKSQFVLQAVEQLDACATEDISPTELALIANIRISHTRRLLTQLTSLKPASIDVWFGYAALLLFFLKDEVDVVLKENAQLKESFKVFLQLRRRECLELLGKNVAADLDGNHT